MAGAKSLRAVFVVCVVGLVILFPGRADAACHFFTVSASPSTVGEGGKVTVTVTRDAAVNPSDVHVTTVNGSATAPSDYVKLDEHVQMTSETSKKYSIAIKDDTAAEGAETFKVHLHDPGGCAVSNGNFELGPDATVTIKASDPVAPKPAPAAPPNAPVAPPAPQVAASATPVVSPTVEATIETTPSPTATLGPQAVEETSGGLPAGAIAGIVVGALAAATGGALLWNRRRAT